MSHAPSTLQGGHLLRVATYNSHKGVRGVGPRKRLEIHNLLLVFILTLFFCMFSMSLKVI